MSEVVLYIYDLSLGLARQLSPVVLGKAIDGIWHTGVVIYNREYFFGSGGIQYCRPSGTALGEPLKKLQMGRTNLSELELLEYLKQLAVTQFRPGTYSLFEHNCNTFSSHLIANLTDKVIPAYICDLPREVLSTPVGALLKPAIDRLSVGLNSSASGVYAFGTPIIDRTNQKNNNHSIQRIRETFGPILFNEPLTDDILPHRVQLLWCAGDRSLQQASKAGLLAEVAMGSGNEDSLFDPMLYDLLTLSNLMTADQCIAVCELFRLNIWHAPDFLMALFVEPKRHLHQLAKCALPESSGSQYLEMEASRAKLLCNCLGLTCKHQLEENSELVLDVVPIVHICLLLLGHEDHRGKTECDAAEALVRLPEHRQIGLALAHNLALHPSCSQEDVLELGTYLLHLGSENQKTLKNATEVVYLLRTIYFLLVRFPILVDLARCQELDACLGRLVLEACDVDEDHLESKPNSSVNNPDLKPHMVSSTLDTLVAALLDILTSEDISECMNNEAVPLHHGHSLGQES